jgi:hypothetical protein
MKGLILNFNSNMVRLKAVSKQARLQILYGKATVKFLFSDVCSEK